MRLAVFSTKSYDKTYFEQKNREYGHDLVYFEEALNCRTVPLSEGFEAVCVFVNDRLDAQVIRGLAQRGVRLILLRCAGFNNVAIDIAVEHGIRVLRVPAYSPYAVAEHAIALIMTLNRKTHKAYNRVRENNFSLERLIGFDVYGKTVGVIGTGKIGLLFARMMNAFGCKVLGFDMYPKTDVDCLEYVSLNDLYRRSDIISLHCPLTPDTHHLINAESLQQTKDGVMIINTSRGALIKTIDVIEALRSRKIGYLGIDVYEQEENIFFKDLSETIMEDEQIARLMAFPNVLITAHQAFFTDTALGQIAQTSLQNLADFQQDAINPINEVTLEMIK